MASINKLSIRGVRSFSPDDEDQVIAFCFPVTIIVGANGCGKTTIIESLKYAVTGSLPPGNKSGQAFVHDPNSVGKSVVKGNIKLRFTNRAGNSMVVIRSMEVTQKKATMSFKALDGILRTLDPRTKERISMSHKCSELDRQIPSLMGVSKPILEHVVFCHQEDSSWPLQEGAVLKKRFDDIFDSTRYAKALESIRKSRLELVSQGKDLKAELAGLASHKHAAEGFKSELDECQDKLDAVDTEIGSLVSKITAQDEIIDRCQAVINRIDTFREEIDARRNSIDKEQTVIAKQRSMLEKDWTESRTEEELRSTLRGFDDSIEDDERRMAECEATINRTKNEIQGLRHKERKLGQKAAKLEAERDEHERCLRQRLGVMTDLAAKYGIELNTSQTQSTAGGAGGGPGTQQSLGSVTTVGTGPGGGSVFAGAGVGSQETLVTVTEEDLDAFQKALDAKNEALADELREKRLEHQREEDRIQSALGDLMAKQKAIENERKKIGDEQEKAKNELRSIQSQTLSHSRVKQTDIHRAKEDAKKYQAKLDREQKNTRREDIAKEIRSNEGKLDSLKRDIEEGQSVVSELRESIEEQNAIRMLQTQVDEDVEAMKESLGENSFDLQKHNLRAEVDAENYASAMETLADEARLKHETARADLERANADMSNVQRQVSEKTALLRHNQQSLSRLSFRANELNADDRGVQKIKRIISVVRQFENREGMNMVDANVQPQELLEHLTNRIGEFTTEEDQPESITRTIQKLKGMAVQKDDHGNVDEIICPCCSRSMNYQEVEVFNNNMENLADPETSAIVVSDRSRAEKNRSAMQNYKTWRNTVSQSVNDYLDYNRIAKEMADTENAVSHGEDELRELQGELDEGKKTVSNAQGDVSEIRQLVDLTARLLADANRIEDKKDRIKEKMNNLAVHAPNARGKDIRTVEMELRAKMEEKDTLMNSIAMLNKETTAINSKITTLSQQASQAEQLAKEKEAKFANEQKALLRKNELNALFAKFKEEDQKLNEQVAPLRRNVTKKESEKQRKRAMAKEAEDKLAQSVNQFEKDVQTLTDLTNRIKRYTDSNSGAEYDRLADELADLEDRVKGKETELQSTEPELIVLQKKVEDQQRHKKTLSENIDLLQSLRGLERLKNDFARLEEEMEAIEGHDTCTQEFSDASTRKKQLLDKKARREGRRGGISEQIKDLERKLRTAEYKDIDTRHQQTMIKHETTVIACSDLEKYYTALDKALLRFHGMKINDINKLIRELWTLTYKGEDITNIELVSGQDKGSRAARSYNYRVQMTKGNTQMDMRGRCSAGQRVLASIVIRLALAETFCLNCGVMALDEPTTNLDYENKRGLAIALAQIIAARARQNNFQLVIITHDEDFVSMMKNELSTQTGFDMPERYFHVSREEGADGKHYSKINAIDWDEL